MRAIVAAAEGSGAVIWPDANQGFSIERAVEFCRLLEPLGVTLFEQSVAMTDIHGMKKLLSATPMTVALDEATVGIPFVIELNRHEAIESAAIKTGGLHYARQLCDLAQNPGLMLIGSGLIDAPIGFAAAVQLYAAYGVALPADLNGPQFIAEDYLRTPFPFEGQRALGPDAPGLGIDIDEAKVARFARDLVEADGRT